MGNGIPLHGQVLMLTAVARAELFRRSVTEDSNHIGKAQQFNSCRVLFWVTAGRSCTVGYSGKVLSTENL
jgi:hypothetical protein